MSGSASCVRQYLIAQDLDATCDACNRPVGDHQVPLTLRDVYRMFDQMSLLPPSIVLRSAGSTGSEERTPKPQG